MKKKSNKKWTLVLMLLLVITVGYAALTSNLKINGTSGVKSATWDVYWDNVQINPGGVSTTTGNQARITDQTKTQVEYSVVLNEPGDFYEFTVDAVNNGTIDAMIAANGIVNGVYSDANYQNKITLPKTLSYTVTYVDGTEIEDKNLLAKRNGNIPTTETYKVRIEYKNDDEIDEDDLDENDQTYYFKFSVNYVQADNTAARHLGNCLKAMPQTNGNTQPAFDNNVGITKEQVEKIYTLDTLELSSELQSNIVKQWDVSEKQDGSIMAYALDTDSNSKYEIYIGQNGGVRANYDSTKLFNYYSDLIYVDLSNLKTDDVRIMAFMFQKCEQLQTIVGLENFNTSKVTDMSAIFNECSSLTSIDVSHFDTKNVTDMSWMFSGCSSLTSIDVSHFDTKNVTDMYSLFSTCKQLRTLVGLENFNTSKVTDMSGMFSECLLLTSIDVSHFDTKNVTTMYAMFNTCKKLRTIVGLENLNTSKVTDMTGMFNNCSSLTSIDVSHFDMSKVTNNVMMFQSCTAAKNIIMPNNYTLIEIFTFNHDSAYNQESFTIPKTVKFVGNSHIFYHFGTTNFKKFIVEDGNTTLKTIDDLLYTYDGTRLLSIPNGKTFIDRTYVMPDSVTTLNVMCFNRTEQIDKLVISDNLVIDRYYDDTASGDNDPVKGNSLNTAIYIFTSIKEYEVKSTNTNYSSYGGCIYSKDGSELIAVPVHYEGVLDIKDGTTLIGQEAFWFQRPSSFTSITTINIPASVTKIQSAQITTLNKLASKGVVINIDPSNQSYQVVNNKIVKK